MINHADKRGWPVELSSLLSKPPYSISVPVCIAGISIFVLLIAIGLLAVAWLLADLVSGDNKRAAEATKAALPVLAAVVGLPLIVWRLVILDRQTKISERKTDIDRETHYTSIFSRAIEQLGQTRELKKTVLGADGPNDTAITVPNIEVRLGGIHSLARLAEESRRDTEKISNMLRSYVRENSWSDRSGSQIAKPDWNPESASTWADDYARDPSDKGARTANTDWIARITSQLEELAKWIASAPETRVDVNEATEALVLQTPSEQVAARPVLYECLFVGRRFSQKLLSLINFKRCTFVKCVFEATDQELQIDESVVLSSTFIATRADIQIVNSELNDVGFRSADQAKIGLFFSQAFSTRILGFPDRASFTFSTLLGLRLRGSPSQRGDKTTVVHLDDTILVQARISGLKLSSDSDLGYHCAVDLTLEDIDLSSVTDFDLERLSLAKANTRTLHPTSIERPSSWPKYRPRRHEISSEGSKSPDIGTSNGP